MTEVLSLRERKKAKQKASIQKRALHLFYKQGYDATTVEDIARAAEISPATFFHYFPTKEILVLHDTFDIAVMTVFAQQPPELPTLRALCNSADEVISAMSPDALLSEEKRFTLISTTPTLRDALLREIARRLPGVVQALARHSGRSVDDSRLQALAGSVVGVYIAVLLDPSQRTVAHCFLRYHELFDELEVGFRDI